jgi:hypothetical protein
MFRSSGIKAEDVQISQSLHQGEKFDPVFSLGIRERALLRAHFHFSLFCAEEVQLSEGRWSEVHYRSSGYQKFGCRTSDCQSVDCSQELISIGKNPVVGDLHCVLE